MRMLICDSVVTVICAIIFASSCALMNIQKMISAFDREEDHKLGVRRLFRILAEKRNLMPNGYNYLCSPHYFLYLPATREQVSISVGLSIFQSVCLAGCLTGCLSVRQTVCLSGWLAGGWWAVCL